MELAETVLRHIPCRDCFKHLTIRTAVNSASAAVTARFFGQLLAAHPWLDHLQVMLWSYHRSQRHLTVQLSSAFTEHDFQQMLAAALISDGPEAVVRKLTAHSAGPKRVDEMAMIGRRLGPDLLEVGFSCCAPVAFAEFLKHCPKVQKLTMLHCTLAVEMLQLIGSSCHQLQRLEVIKCTPIHCDIAECWNAMLQGCNALREMTIDFDRMASPVFVSHHLIAMLNSCPRLAKVTFKGNRYVLCRADVEVFCQLAKDRKMLPVPKVVARLT